MPVSENCKDFINYSYQQIKFQKELVKLKLKIYGIQKKIDADLTSLGKTIYECIEDGKKEVMRNKRVKELIEVIKSQKEDIMATQTEINSIRENINNTNSQLKNKGKEIVNGIKSGIRSTDKEDKEEMGVRDSKDTGTSTVEEEEKTELREKRDDKINNGGK